MEKKEATKVGCQSCRSNKGIKKTQNFLFGMGIIMFVLSVYGTVRLIQDLSSLF